MSHVSSKVVLGLAAAALIAMVAATVTSIARKPMGESARSLGYALPALRDHVNEVKGVILTTAEDKPVVTLLRDDKGWKVQEKGGYPADTGRLRELLLKLADARLLEAKTSIEQHYRELGVEDVKAKDAKGVKVSLEGLGKPSRLIVGNFSDKSNGTFVRRPDERKSWLAEGNLQIERDPVNWLDKSLADIGSERIAEIVLTKPAGNSLRLSRERPDGAAFKLADPPKGRQINDEVVSGLASTLSDLSFTDVSPAQKASAPGEENAVIARYRTFDGLAVEARAWKQDDKHYVRLTAVFDETLASTRIKSEQAKAKAEYEARKKSADKESQPAATASQSPPLAVADPAKDLQQRLDGLRTEVQRLEQRFTGWIFVIASDKYANMDKSLNDILKPVAAKAPTKPKPAAKKPGAR